MTEKPALYAVPAPKVDVASLQSHPAAALFPIMSQSELVELSKDIQRNQLRHPVVLYRMPSGELVVLDGRNRILACKLVNEEIRWSEWPGTDPIGYVISENLQRRHLSESQRAIVAARLATLQRGQRQDFADGQICLSAAAAKLNVSPRSVKSARTILKSGMEELLKAVEDGEVAVSTGEVIARLPAAERPEALARAKDPKPAKSVRNVEHERKLVDVARLHAKGIGTEDIARETGISPTNVSTLKKKIGISANTPAVRLWGDIEHAVTTLEGAQVRIRQLAEALVGAELNASDEEIKRCSKRLASVTGAIRALSAALRARLPPPRSR